MLDKIPAGEFDLVVSIVGYKSYHRRVNSDNDKNINILIRLTPDEIILSNVEIEDRVDKKWQRQFRKFEKEILGPVRFAENCTINNPWVVNFEYLRGRNHYMARAGQPLIVTNEALGYEISYILQNFETRQDQLLYSGYPAFRELEGNNDENISRNRREAYIGSDRHFFFSLVNDKLEEQGFRVYRIINKAYYYTLENIDEAIQRKDVEKIDSENFDIVQTPRGHYSIWLADMIEVFFVPNLNETNSPVLHSRIKMNRPLKVSSHGYVFNPLSYISYGYFAQIRLAYMLPYEYGLDSNPVED
jgi:hypothetical protein